MHQAGLLVLHRVCEVGLWRLVLSRRKLKSAPSRIAGFTQGM